MDTPPLSKIKKSSCPFGEDFYTTIAKHMLSEESGALEELKNMDKMVQSAKLKPTDELWDSGDELSLEVETILKTSNKLKKGKSEKKEKSEEKEIPEKTEPGQLVERQPEGVDEAET